MRRYEQAVGDLRTLLAELAPGARLPIDPDLATHLGVSRGTTRRAVDILKAEGLIQTVQGRGRFVAGQETPRVDAAWERIGHDIRNQVAGQPHGKPLPHVDDIAASFRVSSVTVRRVLRTLVREGIIHRQPGQFGYITGPG